MFVQLHFTLTERDPARPWIVRSIERSTIELEKRSDFDGWARQQWPREEFSAELDPELAPWPDSPGDGSR